MSGLAPILMTQQDAALLARILKRKTIGGPGVACSSSPDEVRISLMGRRSQGGGGNAAECVLIVGFAAANTRFQVKRFDADGEPTGDMFIAYANSFPRDGLGAVGSHDLTLNTVPPYAVGDPLMIRYEPRWNGVEWITDYWCQDRITAYGC